MKLRLLLFGLIVGLCLPSQVHAQVDVTKLIANPKTFIFNNNKNTVKAYINAELEGKTQCCGSDRIYLEVKIDPSGYVLSAKTLTGKNDCFMQSAVDIVKNVKWDTEDFKGPKSIYFEIKPNIDCGSDKSNSYAQVEVFNNELLDKSGNPTGAVVSNTKPAVTTPPPATTPPVTQPQQEIKPATQPVVTNEKPKTEQPQETIPPAVAQDENKEEVQSQEEVAAETTPMVDTKAEMTTPPENLSEEEKALLAQEDQERSVREAEIAKLREQLAQMREKEEEAFRKKEAQERARIEREKRRAEQAFAQGNEGEESDKSSRNRGQKADDVLWEEDTQVADMGEEERIRQRLRELEQQQQGLEQSRQQRLDDFQRQQEESDRENRELLSLKEEQFRVEEQLAQYQEQQELDMLDENRRRAEDARREQENEYQRLMDEISRLQSEAQLKIGDLERLKQDMDVTAAQKQAREQEIMLERAKRELERERRLEEERLTLLNSGLASDNARSFTASSAETVSSEDLRASLLPQLATRADSEKLEILIKQIQILQDELNRLRIQMAHMSAGTVAPGNTGTITQPTPRTVTTQTTTTPGLNNAATTKKWRVDYIAPNEDPSKYKVKPTTPVVVNEEATGQPEGEERGSEEENIQPEKKTHANMEGPKFSPRYYVDGEDMMKKVIVERLQAGGICGLAHVVFSVTLNPQGDVIGHQVLTANGPMVQFQMNTIIPTLKFNAIDARYQQTIYQEVKAEIICEGVETNVNLKEVKSILKKE